MNLSAPFIRRPIGTTLLTLGLVWAGIAAFFQLPVAPLPQIDFPTVQVSASIPGASPSTMATSVAAPLEKQLGTIAGVTEMTSSSGVGSSQIVLQFDLSRDIDGAARDVQAAINAARADLPPSMRSNPTYRKTNPSNAPILILALTSETRTPAQVYDAVSNAVQQRLLQTEGVGDVVLGGAALPAVRIDLNPMALANYGIAMEDVRAALSSASANRPRGVIEGQGTAWQIYGDQPGLHAADFRDLTIAWYSGAAVRLSDVANVYDGPEDVRTMGLFNGKRAVPVIIYRQPGTNIVATVDAIKEQLPSLRDALPDDIKLHIVADRTITIRASLTDVEATLAIATLLVVFVVSIFLRSLRATLIPAAAVVASLLGTIGVMYLLGFSLNNLSLMALTIATGFVADDAIVVLENISRHIEEGMPTKAAVLRGAREIGFTVLSISVSLIAVFVPLLFMSGLIGRLFQEFAVTMAVAVSISLVVSLTTVPMLAAVLLHRDERPGRIARASGAAFDFAQRHYARALDWALEHRMAMMLVFFTTLGLNVYMMMTMPKGFFPEQDTGSIVAGLRADQSISFQEMQRKLTKIVKIVNDDPAVATVVAFTGGSRAGGGFMFINLKPQAERDPTRDIIARLRPKLGRISGVSAFLMPVQDMRAGGRPTNSAYQYTLQSDDPEALAEAGTKLLDLLKQDPSMTDLDIDRLKGGSEIMVQVDRDTAARLGISVASVNAALYDGFGQRQVATIYSGLNQYHVVMGVAPQFTGSPEALQLVRLPIRQAAANVVLGSQPVSTTGNRGAASLGNAVTTTPRTIVPLSSVATWSAVGAPASVNHQDGELSSTISFNTADGVSLGQVADKIVAAQQSAGLSSSVHGGFAGTAKVFAQSTSTMPMLILAALITVYIVLGILYESAIHPLTVISTLPAAGLGAMLALQLAGAALDLIALIGLILLIGIVKKNAIMIIDFALEAERNRGLSPAQAIREASIMRFRPIMMTTFAAAFGALPLAIGLGEGAELRQPLGIAIVGGLIVSQGLTLFTTPVVYLAFDRLRSRSNRRKIDALPPIISEGNPA